MDPLEMVIRCLSNLLFVVANTHIGKTISIKGLPISQILLNGDHINIQSAHEFSLLPRGAHSKSLR